jgi:hypothetical protein
VDNALALNNYRNKKRRLFKMAKKLEGNGMWSSSRMNSPDNVKEILLQNKGIKKLVKPGLDE